jgi:gamma-glutamyltranspeptidase
VAVDHALAAGTGYRVLRSGGSAADAVVAMAAVMTVVQPHYSHLGGDAFAITFSANDQAVRALNSSGPTPAAYNVAAVRALGELPTDGGPAVTVPGCVGGWWALHREMGKLPWAALFDDAIGFAHEGFPATRGLARAVSAWPARGITSTYFDETFGAVSGDGGQVVRQPLLATTLEAIAANGAAGFYAGNVADAAIDTLRQHDGAHSAEDWESPARWLEPLCVTFRGTNVHIQPPPSRGLVLAHALRDYERALAENAESVTAAQFRALEHAFDVVNTKAGDPDVIGVDAYRLLAADAQPRAAAAAPVHDGDTTYMLAVDDDGNAVSFIQSVFAPWGSGVWCPQTGILFNNRAAGFTLEEGHANDIAPRKRPMHTLHCYLATDAASGSLRLVGGAPGAHRQPTTNLQVIDAVVRQGMDPQDALDLPRWSVGSRRDGRSTVELEMRDGSPLGEAFEAAGIIVRPEAGWHGKMGRAFLAVVDGEGIAVGADLRGEGAALAY